MRRKGQAAKKRIPSWLKMTLLERRNPSLEMGLRFGVVGWRWVRLAITSHGLASYPPVKWDWDEARPT